LEEPDQVVKQVFVEYRELKCSLYLKLILMTVKEYIENLLAVTKENPALLAL